jgi:hypothetical protein
MALEGSIRDFGLPDIIQFIQQQNKSGVLTIEDSGRWAKILFEEGKIVFAYTPETDSPAGIAQELIEGEWLPEVKVRSILIGNPDWETFENSLVGPTGLSEEILGQFFILHTTEILYRLFQMKEGKYSFNPEGGTQKPRHAAPMDSDFILLEGMRQFDEWPMLRRQIPSSRILFDKVPEKMHLVRVIDEESQTEGRHSEDGPEAIGISESEMEIYEKIDGHRDVAKLAALSKKGEFETVKALGTLLAKGLLLNQGEREPEGPADEAVAAMEREAVQSLSPKRDVLGNYLRVLRIGPHIGTIVVILILLGWMVIYGPELKGSLESSKGYKEVIHADVVGVEKKKLREALLVYYLRNQQMPSNGKDLSDQIKASGSVIETLEKNGIPIEGYLK